MKNRNVLVIGDSILDHEIFCDALGLSLETPTLKASLQREEFCFGGASNVVNNLLALGTRVTYATPVAEDSFAIHYETWEDPLLTLKPLRFSGQNVVKSRYWISRGDQSYKYLQINQGTKYQDSSVVKNSIYAIAPNFDVAMLIDYRGGLFDNEEDTQNIITTLRSMGLAVYAASQVSDHSSRYHFFRGANLICLNASEAATVSQGFKPTTDEVVKLSKILDARVCVTLGSAGSIIQTSAGVLSAPASAVTAVDTCGAGDSFLAALVASDEDLIFSNKWAAAATQHIGTYTPNLEEVLSWE